MRQQDRARMTYDLVLGAAAAEFALHGYEGTNLADIAARTGLTKGALYGHFSSKADLAGELTRSFQAAWADALATAAGEAEESGAALPTLRRLLLDLARRVHEDVPFAAGLRLVLDAAGAEGTARPPRRALPRRGAPGPQGPGGGLRAHRPPGRPAGPARRGAPRRRPRRGDGDGRDGTAELVSEVWDILEPALSGSRGG
ncbi:TetR/AcrR family transcriptional regulator [Streptomyces tanashiensis]